MSKNSTVSATFNKLSKSEKSALIMIKVSAFQFGATPVYVPTGAVLEALDLPSADKLVKGMPFTIPSGFELVDIIGDDGTVRTTDPQDGSEPINLKQLSYAM